MSAYGPFTYEQYRGTVCIECGWDASYQPPEVVRCLVCDGELVERYATRTSRDEISAPGEVTGSTATGFTSVEPVAAPQTRAEQYAEQADQARRSIESSPAWLRDTAAPPREKT